MKEHFYFQFKQRGVLATMSLYETEEVAYMIARDRGYVERCWYKPSTWNNFVIKGW